MSVDVMTAALFFLVVWVTVEETIFETRGVFASEMTEVT